MEVIGVVADMAPSSGKGVRYGAFGGGGVTVIVVEVLLGNTEFHKQKNIEVFKPTNSQQHLHYHSCHPISTKHSIPYSLAT